MKYVLAMLVAAVLMMAQVGAAAAQGPKEEGVDTTGFALDLYARVAAESKGNVFFSPASVDIALAMTYTGARGATAEQMAGTLHFSGGPEKVAGRFAGLLQSLDVKPEAAGVHKTPYQLVIADALWGATAYPFQADFTRLAEKDFAAGLKSVNFQRPEEARRTINKWVADKTHDKIENLLAEGVITPATRLVLTNAIYFKSAWAEPFEKEQTKAAPFKISPDKSVHAEMMHQRHEFGYTEERELQMLELPYAQGKLSMVLLLPRNGDGLAALENSLTAAHLRDWLTAAKEETVDVTMPKFTFSEAMSLAATLKGMGMTDAFDRGKADFTGVSTAEHLSLSEVIHKAFVAVDEDGTEAAAATGAVMVATAERVQGEPKTFIADHPFVFLIRENATGTILFMGRVCDPAGAGK